MLALYAQSYEPKSPLSIQIEMLLTNKSPQ
jgi:hypothetical protein